MTAGPCLCSAYRLPNERMWIVVVLKCSKLSRRFKETRWVLGWCLAKNGEPGAKEVLKNDPQLDSDNS